MKKIPLKDIDEEVLSFRGIDGDGCFRTACDDECCKFGADVDKESYDLIFEYREFIEEAIGFRIEKCFKKRWLDDSHYLGGNAVETRVGARGFCMFHAAEGKGCVLYRLVQEEDLPRRLIPSICRLYPLTWEDGELMVADAVHASCNCLKKEAFAKSILATQWREVEDIFDLKAKARRKAQSASLLD
jgi:hypothetical protein